MRISDWSSDVCSSDLLLAWPLEAGSDAAPLETGAVGAAESCLLVFDDVLWFELPPPWVPESFVSSRIPAALPCSPALASFGGSENGRASCRERGCQYV